MQMLPFADINCLRTIAAPESGVCALLDAVKGGVAAGFPALAEDRVSLSSVYTTTLERQKWVAQLKTLTLS